MYTTHIHSTCTKVGRCAPHGPKGVREHRGSLALLCSPSCLPIDQVVRAGDEAAPAPSLSVWAASEAERRSRSARRLLRPTHAATLVNATVLGAAITSSCRVFDCTLGAGDHGKGLRHLGPSAATADRCGGSVEGAVGSALISVRDKVWRGEAGGQGGAGRRAHGGRALKLAGGGKDRPLTRVRRAEKSSGLSSFSSRGSWKAPVDSR